MVDTLQKFSRVLIIPIRTYADADIDDILTKLKSLNVAYYTHDIVLIMLSDKYYVMKSRFGNRDVWLSYTDANALLEQYEKYITKAVYE